MTNYHDPNNLQGPDQPIFYQEEPAQPAVVQSSDSKKVPIIIGVLTVLLLLIAGFAVVQLVGNDGSDVADQAGYVDNSGAQQDLPEPAIGDSDLVEKLTITIDGKTAPVDFVQATDNGTLLPPVDVSRVGWYSASAVPGVDGKGSSVITGHINDASQGTGYAEAFTRLKTGDTVTVNVDGQAREFKVDKAPVHVVKGEDLPEVINKDSGSNELVLITCGGPFVGGTLGYADNIIVTAKPA